jgi:hypothetical protein
VEVEARVDDRDPTLERLEDQINWYDQKSVSNQRLFKITKAAQIIAAAAIPVIVLLKYDWPPAALGALVVVLEGFQQLNQYQQNWTAYRSTCEALRHEKFLFLAKAGPYAAASEPRAMLAERIEGLVSHEHAKWVSAREEPSAQEP